MVDLWKIKPEQLTHLRVPTMILNEQAILLGQKTKNIVTASVIPFDPPKLLANLGGIAGMFEPSDNKSKKVHTFYYGFLLVAPALNNYRYHLFTISHPIDLYPIRFDLDDNIKTEIGAEADQVLLAANEEEFLDILQSIFTASKTLRIIQSMYAQSQVYQAA